MRVLVTIIGLLLAGSMATTVALAWDSTGHQTVGAIADRLIAGTNAEAQVRNILGTSLRASAVWADCAKGVEKKGAKFSYTATGKHKECFPFETGPGKAEMANFVRRNWDNCAPLPGEDKCHKQYHYTDVSILRNHYAKGLAGTSNHDIVSAISAAIAVLQGRPAPAPFNINGKKEALRLLSHYAGDIHQPLHVAAIYLDQDGNPVDPDHGPFDPNTETRGGNEILDGSDSLHFEWDHVSEDLSADRLDDEILSDARKLAPTHGSVSNWSTKWATDTLLAAKPAFKGLTFSQENVEHHWFVELPGGYSETRAAVQRQQLIKAGARLAQTLEAIWP
ncbi:MAG TPA: S1/P1 nuclease [Burkholderiales bacterium]|nr:S1/P1 nuclease [Burkholderiales bacterium]